ncbi:MAG: DUF3422 domain-containing protein, partial [Burkholderiaceae bacterium]
HPHRAAIMDEIHARPVDLIPATCRLRRLVFIVPAAPGAMQAIFRQFKAFCSQSNLPVPDDTARQYSFTNTHRHVTWEFHTEFVTVTWRSDLGDKDNYPEDVGLHVAESGLLIGAVRIDVIAEAQVPERLVPGFNLPSLCLSHFESTLAQVATDFVPDAERFVRFELAVGALTQLRRSIIVRRLLEVETYRTMALLALPAAREIEPELRDTEVKLSAMLERMSDATAPSATQAALDELHALSIRCGRISERLSYRFAAAKAYGAVLQARLDGLRESATVRGSTLAHYIGNRVDPALATCSAIEKRLAVLSDKLERAIGLLEVRIGVDMQKQNAALLDSIAQNTHNQFLLQRTVEGLSTIAISYYLLGILSYAAAGWLDELHWQKTLMLSIATPTVLLLVWAFVRRLRNRHVGQSI